MRICKAENGYIVYVDIESDDFGSKDYVFRTKQEVIDFITGSL